MMAFVILKIFSSHKKTRVADTKLARWIALLIKRPSQPKTLWKAWEGRLQGKGKSESGTTIEVSVTRETLSTIDSGEWHSVSTAVSLTHFEVLDTKEKSTRQWTKADDIAKTGLLDICLAHMDDSGPIATSGGGNTVTPSICLDHAIFS